MYSILNFDNVNFPGMLSGMKTIFDRNSEGYTPSTYAEPKFSLGAPSKTMDVIYEVLRAYKGSDNAHRFVASIGDDCYAEFSSVDEDKNYLVRLKQMKEKIRIYASTIDSATDVLTAATFEADKELKKTVLLATMPIILKDPEANDIYCKMSPYLEMSEDSQDWLLNDSIESFAKMLNQFSSNIENRINHCQKAKDAKTTINLDTSNVYRIKQEELTVEGFDRTYIGLPLFFKGAVITQPSKSVSNGVFEGAFAYSERILSDEEKKLVGKLHPSYVMPEFVPEICEFFKESTSFPSPMRVAYLLGPAGTGKTEAANAIAAGLGLPIDHYTCNPNTEIFDFIGQVFPNTGSEAKSYDEVRKELGLPDSEDIVNDPKTAYKQLYGAEPTGLVDEGKLIVEMMERVIQHMATTNSDGKNFVYVESGLIKAARLGYCFEIQEIGTVLRPGVAVGLNALLETGGNAFITLPTGEVIKKHPDATFIFTSNDEYEGTCNLNQSVLDRMSLVYRIDNPPKEIMKERIMSRLSFPDESILNRMIDAIYAISEAARERGITDGVCGYRSLENWCMATMIKSKKQGFISDNIVYDTAIKCVMNKASQKQEYVDELMSSLTAQFAAPKNI